MQEPGDGVNASLSSGSYSLDDLSFHSANAPFIWSEFEFDDSDLDFSVLPKPTRDIDKLKADFDHYGYCLVAEAVSDDDRQAMLDRIVEQYEGELEAGIALQTPQKDARCVNLLTKGEIFQQCLLNPLTDMLLEHALGDSFLVSEFGSVRTVPGSLAQGLHIDQSYIGFPTPVPVVANTVLMLEDWEEETGATRFVPGSHRWSPAKLASMHEGIGLANGDGLKNPSRSIAAEAPAGTCMVFDGRALHGTGRNRSKNRTRTGIFVYHCRPWMRQFENPFLSIPDDVMMSLPMEIRARLGYRPWFLTGGCEAPGMPPPMDKVRPTSFVGMRRPENGAR